jgi:hypothetical protein
MSEIWYKIWGGLHVKYPLFLWDFNDTWNFSTFFFRKIDDKFHENPSRGSRGPCGYANGLTNVTKLIVALFVILRTGLTVWYWGGSMSHIYWLTSCYWGTSMACIVKEYVTLYGVQCLVYPWEVGIKHLRYYCGAETYTVGLNNYGTPTSN